MSVNKNKLVISSMYRAKNKQSFFALHQLQSKINKIDPNIEIEFHILWDSISTEDSIWANMIDLHIKNVFSYNRQFFKDYMETYYGIKNVSMFDVWVSSYFILFAHYLRRVLLYDYYLIYDDDILINCDFEEIVKLMLDKVPVLIAEPMNVGCDKVFLNRLVEIYGNDFIDRYKKRNPALIGVNAGFQGIDLSIYDEFLSVDRFNYLLSLFEFKSIYREDGTEIWGEERSAIDTQQQSFFGLMNIVISNKDPHILNPSEYYVVPNWGTHPVFGDINTGDEFNGWGLCLDSKISHFIGHTQGKGKPEIFLKKVDEYLINQGFDI